MGAFCQHSCMRARQGIPSSQSWKTWRTSLSYLYCCIVGLMVMDCFLCSFDIYVRLYSWLHKCNSCDIAILLFQSFCVLVLYVWLYSWLCKCNSCDITIFLLSMSRLSGPRLEGEDTVTGPSTTHYIFSFSPFF